MSKSVKKIKEGILALHEKVSEAYEKGDTKTFRKYQKEFTEYCRKFQKELKIPDEQIEEMRERILKADVLDGEINYLEAKIKRFKREVEERDREVSEALRKGEKHGQIKWH